MKTIKFNINDYVLVKLTERGKAELTRQREELRKTFPSMPELVIKENRNGYYKEQFWVLMEKLGPMFGVGGREPFNCNIKLVKEK